MNKFQNLSRRMPGGNLGNARAIKHLNPQQVEIFLATVDNYRSPVKAGGQNYDPVKYGALFRMMMGYGLRRSEAAMQLISDVDLKNGMIWIPRIKSGDPKQYPLLKSIRPALEAWMKRRERLYNPIEISEYMPLWTTGTKKRHITALGDKAIAACFVMIMRESEIPPPYPGGHWSIHCLRHTAAMMVLAATGSYANVTDLLGHSSSVAASYYASTQSPERDMYFRTIDK